MTAPVVHEWGSGDSRSPLVVLLHGRGSDEQSMVAAADILPHRLRYAAVRAPIAEGSGYAWFENRGVGRPVRESLTATMAWFREWLDEAAPSGTPVALVGYSGGAAFAGGLILDDPGRYAAAVLLHGTMPFDADLPLTTGRLAGVPVFLAHGIHDTVIPPELQLRTWDYLVRYSGSALWAEREPTGHEITTRTFLVLGKWLTQRFEFLATQQTPVETEGTREPHWPTLPGGTLPRRRGEPPSVSVTTPQQQESQNAPERLQEALYARIGALPEVGLSPSRISVPGARAFTLPRAHACGPQEAYLVPKAGEFAHLHPSYDGSLHLSLPLTLAHDALRKGWAVAHPLAGIELTEGMAMIFGPRDQEELDVVAGIVTASYQYASGTSAGAEKRIGVTG